LRALWGLWVYRIINAECRAALALGQRFCGLSADHADASVPLVGERMLGTSLFFLGDHSNARRHLEHLLSRYSDPMRASHLVRFQLDLPVSARATLSPVLWLQGFPDQAMRLAEDNIEDACAIDHAPSLCNALANTGMVALAIGDLEAAERAVAMLREFSARHALGLWRGSGHGYEGWLLIKRGDVVAGIRCLRAGLDDLRDNKFVLSRQALLGALAQGLASVGQVTEGLAAIDEALAQCRRTDELWDIAELLRVRGELLLQHGAPGAAIAAEDHFLQALDWARRQGALWWELGGATSLARLWRERRRAQQARELLAPVYDRFTERFSTADLRAARALIDELS
jgi:predicted ATPase